VTFDNLKGRNSTASTLDLIGVLSSSTKVLFRRDHPNSDTKVKGMERNRDIFARINRLIFFGLDDLSDGKDKGREG
jgi:hypothetical protein